MKSATRISRRLAEGAIASSRNTGPPVARQVPKPSQDRLIETLGSGTDLTLVDRSLRMTPTERIETMRRAALSLAAMRR